MPDLIPKGCHINVKEILIGIDREGGISVQMANLAWLHRPTDH